MGDSWPGTRMCAIGQQLENWKLPTREEDDGPWAAQRRNGTPRLIITNLRMHYRPPVFQLKATRWTQWRRAVDDGFPYQNSDGGDRYISTKRRKSQEERNSRSASSTRPGKKIQRLNPISNMAKPYKKEEGVPTK